MRFFTAVLVLVCACGPSFAADYYVRAGGSNGNSGTSPQQAWATVAYAFQRVVAGDTVYVGAGRYVGQIYVDGRAGRADAPIRFVADVSGTRTGDAGNVVLANGSGLLHLRRCDYTQVEGFRMEVDSGSAVYNDGSIGVVIAGCEVVSSGAGLHGTGNATMTVRGTTIEVAGGHGVYLSGGSGEIEDTTIDVSIAWASPVFAGGRAGLTLRRSGLFGGGHGMYVDGGTVVVTDTVIAFAGLNGIHAANRPTLTLVHVTIHGAGQDGLYADGGSYTVRNSIFSDSGRYAVFRAGGSFAESHNLYHGSGVALAYGFTPSGPLTDAPGFSDADARLFTLTTGSPAIDAGMDMSALTLTDREGLSRPAGAGWDLGAHEFDGTSGAVAAAVPYQTGFATLGAEWLGARTAALSTGGSCLGKMGRSGSVNETASLHLRTTPGTEYQLVYTLVLFDGWDFSGGYRDTFRVRVDGSTVSQPLLSPSLAQLSQNIGGAGTRDRVYRAIPVRFTASGSETVISFVAENTGDISEEGWGLDDVRVMPAALAYAAAPYAQDFEGTVGAEWTATRVESQAAALGAFLGRFGVNNEHAALLGVETTPGEAYTLRFDIFFLDSWDAGEEVRVSIGGTEVVSLFAANGYQRPPVATFAGSAADQVGYLGFGANHQDALFRGVTLRFTAASARTDIAFRGTSNQAASDESWGLDNVSVRQGERRRIVRWREISSVDAE